MSGQTVARRVAGAVADVGDPAGLVQGAQVVKIGVQHVVNVAGIDPVVDDVHDGIVGRRGGKPQRRQPAQVTGAGGDDVAAHRGQLAGQDLPLHLIELLRRGVRLDVEYVRPGGHGSQRAGRKLQRNVGEIQDLRGLFVDAAGQRQEPVQRGLQIGSPVELHRHVHELFSLGRLKRRRQAIGRLVGTRPLDERALGDGSVQRVEAGRSPQTT